MLTEHGSPVYTSEMESGEIGGEFRPHLSLKVPVTLERLHCVARPAKVNLITTKYRAWLSNPKVLGGDGDGDGERAQHLPGCATLVKARLTFFQ